MLDRDSPLCARSAELLFKVGDPVYVKGCPFKPFIDTTTFAGIVKGVTSHGAGMEQPCGVCLRGGGFGGAAW